MITIIILLIILAIIWLYVAAGALSDIALASKAGRCIKEELDPSCKDCDAKACCALWVER